MSPCEPERPLTVEAATLRELEGLGEAHSARGQVALALARALDGGSAMPAAGIAKELRATLDALIPEETSEDALTAFLRAAVPASFRNNEESE